MYVRRSKFGHLTMHSTYSYTRPARVGGRAYGIRVPSVCQYQDQVPKISKKFYRPYAVRRCRTAYCVGSVALASPRRSPIMSRPRAARHAPHRNPPAAVLPSALRRSTATTNALSLSESLTCWYYLLPHHVGQHCSIVSCRCLSSILNSAS
jgi:hypothetical protein